MALTAPVVFSSLQSARSAGALPMLGLNFDRLAQAIAVGVVTWAVGQPQNLALLGTVTGVAGSGTVNSASTRLVVPPSVPVMAGALASAGMVGPATPSLAAVVAVGISSALTLAGQFAGAVPGVSNGTSQGVVTVSNAASLAAVFSGVFPGIFGGGPASLMLIQGLSRGIAGVLQAGTAFGQVAGIPSPVPPVPATTVAVHVVI